MRIQSIDVLRGIAILGILIMNIGFHFVILTGYVNFEPIIVIDRIIIVLQGIFADGRFRTLFCLLFGTGLAILYEHCQRKGMDAVLFIKSRLFWLLIIGIVHAVFIFGGDILLMYAISGFIAVKHLTKSQKEILLLGKKLFVVGSVIGLILATLALVFTPQSDIITRTSPAFESKHAFVAKNYVYFMGSNAFSAAILLLFGLISFIWQIVGIMLFGIYLYREQFFSTGFSPSNLNKIFITAVVFTVASVSPLIIMEQVDTTVMPMIASISALFVALLYAHICIKWLNTDTWLKRTLANCGKMALTLYIGQSIVMAIFFRLLLPTINPNYVFEINLLHLMSVVVVMTILQMLSANVLMSRFNQGPLESLWRKLYLGRYHKKVR